MLLWGMLRRFIEGWQSLRWDKEFWPFALAYLLWPPFAWSVSLGLPSHVGRLIRWTRPVIDYIVLALAIMMVWLSGRALVAQDWFQGIVVLFPLASTLLVLGVRLQLPYLRSYRSA